MSHNLCVNPDSWIIDLRPFSLILILKKIKAGIWLLKILFDGIDRWKVGRENLFFRYNFVKHELINLLIIYTMVWQLGTIPDRNHTVPGRLGSAAHEILKIIDSPLPYTFWTPGYDDFIDVIEDLWFIEQGFRNGF